MNTKTEEIAQKEETVTVVTTQKDIRKKLNELAGTNNKFQAMLYEASRSNPYSEPKTYTDLIKSEKRGGKEKGYKLQSKKTRNSKNFIGSFTFVPLMQIRKVLIEEPDNDGRRPVIILLKYDQIQLKRR